MPSPRAASAAAARPSPPPPASQPTGLPRADAAAAAGISPATATATGVAHAMDIDQAESGSTIGALAANAAATSPSPPASQSTDMPRPASDADSDSAAAAAIASTTAYGITHKMDIDQPESDSAIGMFASLPIKTELELSPGAPAFAPPSPPAALEILNRPAMPPPPSVTPVKQMISNDYGISQSPQQMRTMIGHRRASVARHHGSIPPSPVVDPGALHELDDPQTPGRRRSSATGGIAGLEELRNRESERMLEQTNENFNQLLQAGSDLQANNVEVDHVVDAMIRLDFEPANEMDREQTVFIKQLPVIFGRRDGNSVKNYQQVFSDGSMIIRQNPGEDDFPTLPVPMGMNREKKKKKRKKKSGKSGKSNSSGTPDIGVEMLEDPDDIPIIHLPLENGLTTLTGKKSISRQHLKIYWDQHRKQFQLDILGKNGAFVDGEYLIAGTQLVIPERGYTVGLGDSTTFRITIPPNDNFGAIVYPRIPGKFEEPEPQRVAPVKAARNMSFDFQDEFGRQVKTPRYGGKNIELVRSLASASNSEDENDDDSGEQSDEMGDEDVDAEDGDIEYDDEEDDWDEELELPIPRMMPPIKTAPEFQDSSSDLPSSSSDDEEVLSVAHTPAKRGPGHAKIVAQREQKAESHEREREKMVAQQIRTREESEQKKRSQKEAQMKREHDKNKALAWEQERLHRESMERLEKNRKLADKNEKAKKPGQERKIQPDDKPTLFLPTARTPSTTSASATPSREPSVHFPAKPSSQQSPPPQPQATSSNNVFRQPPFAIDPALDPALFAPDMSVSPAAPSAAKRPKEPRPKKEKPPPKKKRTPSPELTEADFPPEALIKPNNSYVVLIYEAISSASGALSLPQIYKAIEDKYPYFKVKVPTNGWQSSVRHNLSQNRAFQRVERAGKGWLWGIVKGVSIEREKKGHKPQPGPHMGYSAPGFAYPNGTPIPYFPQNYPGGVPSYLGAPAPAATVPAPPSYFPQPPAYQTPAQQQAAPRSFDAPIPPPPAGQPAAGGAAAPAQTKVPPDIMSEIHQIIEWAKRQQPADTALLADIMNNLQAGNHDHVRMQLQKWKIKVQSSGTAVVPAAAAKPAQPSQSPALQTTPQTTASSPQASGTTAQQSSPARPATFRPGSAADPRIAKLPPGFDQALQGKGFQQYIAKCNAEQKAIIRTIIQERKNAKNKPKPVAPSPSPAPARLPSAPSEEPTLPMPKAGGGAALSGTGDRAEPIRISSSPSPEEATPTPQRVGKAAEDTHAPVAAAAAAPVSSESAPVPSALPPPVQAPAQTQPAAPAATSLPSPPPPPPPLAPTAAASVPAPSPSQQSMPSAAPAPPPPTNSGLALPRSSISVSPAPVPPVQTALLDATAAEAFRQEQLARIAANYQGLKRPADGAPLELERNNGVKRVDVGVSKEA